MKPTLKHIAALTIALLLVPALALGLDAPSLVRVKRTSATSLKIWWKQVHKANGYIIYRYNPKTKKYKKVKKVAGHIGSNWIDKGLKTNKTYSYKVKAYDNYVNTDGDDKVAYSPLSYKVSAKPYGKAGKVVNVIKVNATNGFTIGIREKRKVSASTKADTYSKAKKKKLLSKKLVYSLTNKKIAALSKTTVEGKAVGKTTLKIRAHDGVTKNVLVTVKNYALPTSFNFNGVPSDMAAILADLRVDMTAVADYFLQHPEAGTGDVWLHDPGAEYDVVLTTNGTLQLGSMRETINRLLNACPYDLRVVVWEGGIVFDVGYFYNGLSYHYSTAFDYFLTEWPEAINRDAFLDIASRWYFSGGPGL